MRSKPVIPRHRAEGDIDEAFAFYIREAGTDTALAFVDSLEQAITHVSRYPASGSPAYAQHLNIPGLRHWKTNSFPYLIFYVEMEKHVEIWRVLHGKRDIPDWMQEED